MEVRAFAVFCALAALVLGGGGCLLFTDDFNKPPHVSITGPDVLFRGETKRFSAVVDDEEGGGSFQWVVVAGKCPATLAEADDASRRASRFFGDQTFDLPKIDKAGPSCVVVIVSDRAGARSFTGKGIDVKDRVLVIHEPASVTRNQPARFSAAFLTDAGDQDDVEATGKATFAWGRDRSCTEAEKAALLPTAPKGSVLNVEAAPRRSFCVSVFGLDQNGISAIESVEIMKIDNTGPVASIVMQEPALAVGATPPTLSLFTTVKLSGPDGDDVAPEDAGNFSWTLTRPGGQTSVLPGAELTFTTETAGQYQIELTITEEGMIAKAAPLPLTVVDAPPCIVETEPSFITAPRFVNLYDQPRTFRVTSVSDDGDPVPGTMMRPSLGRFVWSARKLSDEPGQMPEMKFPAPFMTTLPELPVPARTYQPGDKVEVRVEYLDRHDVLHGARDLSHCKDNEPRCAVMGAPPNCFQRLTWTVEYL